MISWYKHWTYEGSVVNLPAWTVSVRHHNVKKANTQIVLQLWRFGICWVGIEGIVIVLVAFKKFFLPFDLYFKVLVILLLVP